MRVLGLAQRIVLVIALGIALSTLGLYLMTLKDQASFGWFAYAPLNTTTYAPHPGLATWARLLIWLGLLAVWTLASLVLLRPRRQATLT